MIDRFLYWGDHVNQKSGEIKGSCQPPLKVAKGIAKHITKQEIRHEHYKQCLFHQNQQMASMKQLRSFQHNIFSIKLNKIGLSPFDNKRYVLGNGCDTLAYGHYTLREHDLDQHDQELIELLVDL